MFSDLKTKQVTLDKDGAQLYSGILAHTEVTSIIDAVADFPADRAGLRIMGVTSLEPFIGKDSKIHAIVKKILGADAKPVRAVLFDKNPDMNWSLKWHQDRTIVVKQRIETAGYGPWSIKSGLQHVAPPYDLLAQMVTVRVHLDKVDLYKAPLLIALGSHKFGRITEAEINNAVENCGAYACLAEAGDVWVYSTPIIHASEASQSPDRRRVLQVDYSSVELPNGLEWLGV